MSDFFIHASIPLAHETLSQEEVAERLVKAAKKAGYEADRSSAFGNLYYLAKHFIVYPNAKSYDFHTHSGSGSPKILTLEQFEEHCDQLSNSKTQQL